MDSTGHSRLRAWCDLLQDQKSLFGWPSWNDIEVTRESRKAATEAGRLPFQSDMAARTELLASLADENEVAIEDCRVRLAIWKHRPLEDITATFEVFSDERWTCISRIDFLPVSPHPNRYWRKFGLEPEVKGSHIHGCEDNARLGMEAFAPIGNLPNARGLDKEPQSFRDICRSIEDLFVISGFEVTTPEWNWSLKV